MTEPLNVSAELAKAIGDATEPAAIRAALIAEAEKQGLDASVVAAATAAAAQKTADEAAADEVAAAATSGFTRTVNIGGRDFTFEEDTELALERAVNNAYTVAYAMQTNEPDAVVVPPAATAAEVAAAAEADLLAKTELELKFKRGEISTAEFIDQSGAVKDYLAAQGIPLDEIRASVEANRDKNFEMSWEEATAAFLRSPAGSDWPGGQRNLQQIGLTVGALDLTEAKDKVAALAQAYQTMKQSRMIFDNDTVPAVDPAVAEAARVAAAAATAAEAARVAAGHDPAALAEAARVAAERAAAQYRAAAEAAKIPSASSTLFGQSSGAGNGAGATEKKVAAQVTIPKDATPQEILEAWKAGQVAAGVDPNAAFEATFASHRR